MNWKNFASSSATVQTVSHGFEVNKTQEPGKGPELLVLCRRCSKHRSQANRLLARRALRRRRSEHVELPFGATTTALGFGAASGKAQNILVPTVETLHWGLSIQYSTYYLTSRFTGGPPKDEPLNQLLPLVEVSFDTPRGQNTAATMNPGFAYVAVAWQFAAEVIVPLNRDAGNATGFRAQLLFFLDDLIPKLFDKSLLSDKPDRSLIAWH